MSTLIQINNISKIYKRGSFDIPVLQNLSLSVEEGEFLALMGPSGSGKTTLLNLISGIDKPTSGDIIIGGTNIGKLSETDLATWRSHHVGFVFQFYNLLPVLTAYENVELPLTLTNLSKKQKKERVEMMLKIVGLADRMDHYPKQLSGGQQQRVAIARAIVTDPSLIIGDEPTGDLDKKSAEEILILMERLNSELKKTIVMVTHDPHAAERAKRIQHLDKGELISN